MDVELRALGSEGLQRFQALQSDAVSAVTERFYATHGSAYEKFGLRGRDACREDLAFHLEFLRPVLEFGLLQPMVDYLCWLGSVLAARGIPVEHVGVSLEWLGEFFAGRMDAADGAVVSAALKSAWANCLKAQNAPVTQSSPTELWPEAAAFEAALLAGFQGEALAVMNRCIDRGHSLVDVELNVIQASLYQIGEQWQAGQVSVAQEHMATAIVQSVMTAGLLRSPPPAMIGKRVLLACVEGNHHAIGLRMVSDAFQLAGWDVQYLGANVPTPALVGQAAEWKPDLVGLSVSFVQQLRVVKDVIARLGERLGSIRPAIIIGGLAINRFNQLAGMVGADAHSANAQAAVIYANQSSAVRASGAVVLA
jgi:MerR family transcriptional regulator, light-induced transcriptional regulator